MCFERNPEKRVTARELLKHSYFKGNVISKRSSKNLSIIKAIPTHSSKKSLTKGRFIKNSLRIVTMTENNNKNQNSQENTLIHNIEASSDGFSVSLTVYSNDGEQQKNDRNFLNITVSDN